MSSGKALQINVVSQFLALLYKELLLRKRHYISTAFEIIFPIIIVTVPLKMFIGIPEISMQERPEFQQVGFTTFEPLDLMSMYNGVSWEDLEFVYAPSNEVTDDFMDDSLRTFFGRDYGRDLEVPTKMNSEEELKKYILEEQKVDESKVMIGTVFKGFGDALPKDLDYKIYYTRNIDTRSKYFLNGPRISPDYKYTYFLQWQTAVGDAFIQKKARENYKAIDYKIFLQTFPYPEYKKVLSEVAMVLFEVEFYLQVALIFFVAGIVKRIIQGKNDGTKELMESMGMTKFPYWATIFTNNFIIAFIFTLIITIIFKVSAKNTQLYMQSDFMLVFIILLLFMANLILFCMTFSIFFNRVAYAVIALMMVHLLSLKLLARVIYSGPYGVGVEGYFSFSLFHKLCICIHPVGSLLTSFLIIHLFEGGNEGVQWKNLTHYPMVPDINMLMVIAMMLFSCFFYTFTIWYFDAVWPWQQGKRRPFYFFFTKSYWRGEVPVVPDEIELVSNERFGGNLEVEPTSALRSVVIKDLSKVIQQGRSSKVVLHDVSLKCYQGQITALVGHSEAGKSSLINILTGKELPTKGSASIIGLDISNIMTRKNLGVSPQLNILYEGLSVVQHLKMYAAMKGTSLGLLTYEADQVLNSLQLSRKKTEMASNLSFADKRKLSLALAIVGGSKVLLLDEPTYGMDAEDKKHVWDALQLIKHDRTIIVTTQTFEEADILGDQIAVMAEGEIQSCGTPAFIKQKLGAGYHLHVLKHDNFDFEGLKSLIAKHVPTMTCENDSHKEVSFNLGTASELGGLFEELESRKTDLGIISYGVSLSTIRDVSLTVSNMIHSKKTSSETENTSLENKDESRDTFHPALHASLNNQFRALLLKHFLYCKRRWKFHIAQIAIPFLLILACFACIKATIKINPQPLELDISSVYGSTDGFFYNTDPTSSDLARQFKNVLESNDVSVEQVPEPTHYVLDYGKKNLAKYLKRLVVGGAFDSFSSESLNLTAWHNSGSAHSMPMSLLLMQTALLRYIANTGSMSLAIEPVIPLRDRYEDVSILPMVTEWAQFFVPLVFTFVSLSFILAPTHERATGAKLLQLMSGVPAAMYWIMVFLWDFFIYLVVCIFLIMTPAFFFPSVFLGVHSEAIGTLCVLLFLYGWSSLPLGYIVSTFIKRENRGIFIFIGYCILFGLVSMFMLDKMSLLLSIKDLYRMNDEFWFFRLFPIFSVSTGTLINFQIAFHNSACDMFTPSDLARCPSASLTSSRTLLRCCKHICNQIPQSDRNFVECHQTWNHLTLTNNENYKSNGPEALLLGLEGIIFFAVLILLETRTAQKCLNIIKLNSQEMWNQIIRAVLRREQQVLRDENTNVDPQVLQEEERIKNLTSTQQGSGGEALAILGLTKCCEISSSKSRLTFGVIGEECFGIVGVNGAGKTSMYRMLTGDDFPKEGNAFIHSFSLMGDFRKFQSHIGYCPEFNSLLDDLTGREMLLLFGQLRGLSGHVLQKNVNELIQSIGLIKWVDEPTNFYSGGDKRKLSVALALVGSPPVILLDEPTARVDLESRRDIWRVLTRVQKTTGAAILLATQSIEESEGLCNRLAIMVNGRFHSLGSADQLKSKHGQGYALTLKMSKEHQNDAETLDALKNHIQNSLKNTTLTNDYQGILQYHVVDESITIGHLFQFMSDVNTQYKLEDYSIDAISLEQIFLACSRK